MIERFSTLIGYTGFIGSFINKHISCKYLYNSENIHEIGNHQHDYIICAGISSLMWQANKNPLNDFINIKKLLTSLSKCQFNKIILLSTIEVYAKKNNVDENSKDLQNKKGYGYNRALVENFIINKFNNFMIIRFPIVYGENYKKNFLFDLQNNIKVNLNLSDKMQFYNVKNIIKDIKFFLEKNFSTVNLATEPIFLSELVNTIFNEKKHLIIENNKIEKRNYNMKTIYSSSNYWMMKREIIQEMINFFK